MSDLRHARKSARRRSARRLAAARAWRFVFARRCVFCGKGLLFYNSGEMCAGCAALYAKLETRRCPVCALDALRCFCSRQRRENLAPGAIALGFFFGADDAAGKMIYAFKRDGSRELTRFFARALAARIMRSVGTGASGALVTYPPRVVSSVWDYGFDHAKKLARETARYLGADFANTLVRIGGAEQKNLGAAGRAQNVRGVFAFRSPPFRRTANPVEGRSVILVDDVATTGATLAEAARVLREAGAARVIFAVLYFSAPKAPSDGLWFEDDTDGGGGDAFSDDVGF